MILIVKQVTVRWPHESIHRGKGRSWMWQGIRGHDEVVERFRLTLEAGRLASTYLFVGPSGIGKRSFALKLAQALLCQRTPDERLEPCGECESCRLLLAGNHPDVIAVGKPAGKNILPLETFIGTREQRMRSGFCHEIAMKPFLGGRRVGIIDDADYMNQESANSLLKTLEEPPPRSVLILIGTSAGRQLPTILSRCQIVRFAPLPLADLEELLVATGIAGDRDEAARLAPLSEGSLERAAEICDAALTDFRGQLFKKLAVSEIDNLTLAREVSEFVDAAGKDAPARRNRLRQVIAIVVEYYRAMLRALSGAPADFDPALQQAITRGAAIWPGDVQHCAACLERSLDALEHIDRNANQSTMIECWLHDLSLQVKA